MIWIALHVLIYAIIIFDGFYASETITSGIIASNDLDLQKVNTVQPIRYPKSLDANKIKSVIRQN